ncbi:hypothetical protein [Paraburkholderia sp. J41]|uniref:hypothetical protein n=1 Tax=Paraburkholderia sp. J41 TaxID=2805433 RepID=UPI002AC36692|nr:hypothetical protein [Paraburkholderia sp. J41]
MDRLRMAENQLHLDETERTVRRSQRGATGWVVVLVLPALIVVLIGALEVLGLIARFV